MSAGAVEAKQQEQASADAAVATADANLAAARQDTQRLAAERAGLRQQRDNVRLLAPAQGVVISRDAEAGSTVVAGQAVLRLIEPASLWIRVRLDQGRSAGLVAGLPASIVLRSNPSVRLSGKVARVEATSDSITEERVALVSLDTLPSGLSTGELAEVTLTLACHGRGRVAAQPRDSTPGRSGRRVANRRRPAEVRAGAHRAGQPRRPGAGARRPESR